MTDYNKSPINQYQYSELKLALSCGYFSVKHDSFDREVFFENFSENDFNKIKTLDNLLPASEILLQDLFCIFFKATVRLEPFENLAPSGISNRILIEEAVLSSEVYKEIRIKTFLKGRTSVLAAMATAQKLAKEIQNIDITLSEYIDALEDDISDEIGSLTGSKAKNQKKTSIIQELEGKEIDAEDDEFNENITKKITQSSVFIGEKFKKIDTEDDTNWGKKGGGILNLLPFHERVSLKQRIMSLEKFRNFLEMSIELQRNAINSLSDCLDYGAEEVHEITTGKDLAMLLPVELTSLINQVMKKGFYKRLIDSELLQYDIFSRQSKGALTVCVDTSHSMEGDNEIFSKALALALRELAIEQERTFRAILFGSKIQPVKILSFENTKTDDLVELAEFYYGSGTDFEKPLRAALKIQIEDQCPKGDIVFLTDGQCELEPSFIDELKNEKLRLDLKIVTIVMDLGKSCDLNVQAPLSDKVKYASEFLKKTHSI